MLSLHVVFWKGGRLLKKRSPAGLRRLGTATRISASLFRRLSAFFWSTPGQDPKAAKYAVLTPGPGIFVNVRNGPRVVIPPPSETPRVSPCEPLCAIFLRETSVCPLSHGSETLRGRVSERQTLPLLGLGWVYFRRTQKAFGTAMRLCASLFRGVAAPLGCVIPLLLLSPH